MITLSASRSVGLLLIFVFVSLLSSGCRTNSHSDEVQVRLINAMSMSRGLTVSVDGQRVWKDSRFRSSTGYQGMGAGTYGLRLDADTSGTGSVLSRPMTFEKGHRYTVLALGRERGSAARVQLLDDEASGRDTPEKAQLRLIEASAQIGPVDLVVNNIVGVKAVGFGKRSPALLLDRGNYDLKVVSADTPDTVAGPISLRLEAGHSYTLVTMGEPSSGDLTLEAYSDTP